MTRFQQLDDLVHHVARARKHLQIEWELGLLDGALVLWEDEAFFAANETLTDAILAVIRERDNAEVKS